LGVAFCGAGAAFAVGWIEGSEVEADVGCVDSGAGASEVVGSALGAYLEAFKPLFAAPPPPRPPLCRRSCPSLRPFLCAGFAPLLGTFADFSSMTGAAGVSSTVKVGTDTGSNSSAKRSSSSLDCANSSIASPSCPRLQALRLRRKRDGAGRLGGKLGRDLDHALGIVRG
jgi:hypothetical protein